MRLLLEHCAGPEGLEVFVLELGGRFALAFLDEPGYLLLVNLSRQMRPTGQRRQVKLLDGRVLETLKGFAAIARGKLLSPVIPDTLKRLVVENGSSGTLDFSVKPAGKGVRYRIAGPAVPPGGVVVRWQDKESVVRELPAEVVIRP